MSETAKPGNTKSKILAKWPSILLSGAEELKEIVRQYDEVSLAIQRRITSRKPKDGLYIVHYISIHFDPHSERARRATTPQLDIAFHIESAAGERFTVVEHLNAIYRSSAERMRKQVTGKVILIENGCISRHPEAIDLLRAETERMHMYSVKIAKSRSGA
jgi:hypothetical protein